MSERNNEKKNLLQEEQPRQPPPPYTRSQYQDAMAETPSAGMIKFPSAFNVYFDHKDVSSFNFGTSSDAIFSTVSTNWEKKDAAFSLIIHDGPTQDAPILATTGDVVMSKGQEAIITLPVRQPMGASNEGQLGGEFKARFEKSRWGNFHFAFTIITPASPGSKDPPREEIFQWRSSRGDEIKSLDFDLSSADGGKKSITFGADGWKLVRMTPSKSRTDAMSSGEERKERDAMFASDGREIVALLGQARALKTNNPLRFAFTGLGMTGLWGRDWEVVSVATGLLLYWTDGILGITSAPPGMSGLSAKKKGRHLNLLKRFELSTSS